MRRLTPLLANLGVASVFRLILPITLAAGGERYLYYTMSLFFPYTKCPSYQCFRFLPPLIPSLLPLEAIDAFLVTGFVCQVLAGTLLWHIAERMTESRRVALLTTAWFWAIWGPLPTLRDPLLIADPVRAAGGADAGERLSRHRAAFAGGCSSRTGGTASARRMAHLHGGGRAVAHRDRRRRARHRVGAGDDDHHGGRAFRKRDHR